jgi:hypothetical protein
VGEFKESEPQAITYHAYFHEAALVRKDYLNPLLGDNSRISVVVERQAMSRLSRGISAISNSN